LGIQAKFVLETLQTPHLSLHVKFDPVIMDEDMEYDSRAASVPQQQQYQTPVPRVMPEDGQRLLLVLHAHLFS
jgi:hypothetical protein